MVDVDVALSRVLKQCAATVASPQRELVPLAAALGRRLAADALAGEPFPSFAAAILDGYAVQVATDGSADRDLTVAEYITAGIDPSVELNAETCAYITTGSKMPPGANAVVGIEKTTMRRQILDKGERADGRGLDDIRAITSEVGVLPRTHGSALFTRGQTQALAVTTNCSLDFMRKPESGRDVIAHCRLLKLGRMLAVCDVLMASEGSDKPVARASLTYSIPPR